MLLGELVQEFVGGDRPTCLHVLKTSSHALADYLEWERQDYQEAVEGVRRGLEDVKAGRTVPADEFLDKFAQKHGLPR